MQTDLQYNYVLCLVTEPIIRLELTFSRVRRLHSPEIPDDFYLFIFRYLIRHICIFFV